MNKHKLLILLHQIYLSTNKNLLFLLYNNYIIVNKQYPIKTKYYVVRMLRNK